MVATVTYPNGLILDWDDSLSPGDFVSVGSEYFVVQYLEYRKDATPLVVCHLVVDRHGMLMDKLSISEKFDAHFVHRVTRSEVLSDYQNAVNTAIIRRENLLGFVTD